MDLKLFLNKFSVSLLFYLLLFSLFFSVIFFTEQAYLLRQINLLNWDAINYYCISNHGYNAEYLTAYFPLFPFVWKVLNVLPLGISIINGFFFSISISLIVYHYKIRIKEHLLLLSIPSLFFMFIPYTEAFFFFAGTLLIIGLDKNNVPLITIGLLLSSMIRPTAYVFIPAIIITELITKTSIADFLKRSFYFSLIILAGLFCTVFIQYLSTGKWFVFFDAQKQWNNYLRLPQLPLTSWSGDNITRLDGTALLVGLISIYVCVRIFISFYRSKMPATSRSFLFSLLYLAGISLLILLFRGGSLFSLNRFIYASPFFILCFSHFLNEAKFKMQHIYLLFLGFSLYWLLFASYVHIQTFGKYELLTLFVLLPFLLTIDNKKINSLAYYCFITINILLQLFFMYRFISGEWVG